MLSSGKTAKANWLTSSIRQQPPDKLSKTPGAQTGPA
jgi:hypothetical protein